ncbi:MAG TPA: histidine kinase, partial [Puia sp.]
FDFFFDGANNHVSFTVVGDSLAYRNQPDGATEFNIGTGATRKFHLGVHISRTFRDDEGNTWFTSLGQGIFRLNSDEFKNINLSVPSAANCAPHVIVKMDSDLWVGCNNNALFVFSLPSMKKKATFTPDQARIDDLQFIGKEKNGKILVGTTTRLYDFFFKKPIDLHRVLTVKDGILRNDSEFVAAGGYGIYTIDINDLHVKDTLFKDRATAIRYIDGSLYIGTINGLYVLRKDRSIEYWGDSYPNLRKRISAIQSSPEGVIWVATYGDGISAYKGGKLAAVVTRKQGLSSDICRTIRLEGNILWVGTDKGLNKVDISKPGYPVITYTANDGLGSDIIDAIFTDSQMVYVGTPAGLSFFNPTLVDRSARCRLALTGLVCSGKDRLQDTAFLQLPYSQNNIRFEFAGISYKSAGNILYQYRLLGLDTSWQTTRESFLDYPTLPSGEYKLQLQAVNVFGKESSLLSLHFSVTTPFWRSTWFLIGCLIFFFGIIWLFVSLRIKHIRRQQNDEELLARRMTELEHTALQAQMNPHFIFNCLNSIQQYIFDQDILAANKYITGFARLIRATLHNSTKDLIPLEDELEYLSTYLSLEKLRFKEKMSYTIEVAPDLPVDGGYWVPPMIIQPYVENCMRHGLRHRKMAGGYIRISLREENGKLTVIVEDNGIGREKAASYKTREHIEYQSKGMSLTADRIRLINSSHEENIEVEIIDLKDAQGIATGTRVVLKFPKFDLTYQENTI